MELAEVYRLRGILTWYVGLQLGFALLAVSLGYGNHIHFDDSEPAHGIRLSQMLGPAMIASAIVAGWISLALNCENARLELVWTRPISRSGLAARFVAIDIAALAFAYLFMIAVICLWAALGGLTIMADREAFVTLPLSFGTVVMWYALLLAASAGVEGRGTTIVGLAWPVSLLTIVIGSAPSTGALQYIANLLNYLNPFAYSDIFIQSGHREVSGVWGLPAEERALVVWLLAASLCTLGVWLWQRREI